MLHHWYQIGLRLVQPSASSVDFLGIIDVNQKMLPQGCKQYGVSDMRMYARQLGIWFGGAIGHIATIPGDTLCGRVHHTPDMVGIACQVMLPIPSGNYR
jgi:hypothetical protein